MAYFKAGAFRDDPWSNRAFLSSTDWAERRSTASDPVALRIEPGFAVETLAKDVGRFDLIAIMFPKFTDGRGYSIGWLLRDRLGYTGEMRAVGDVLFDEMQFMVRCGFDAFEITDAATLQLLRDGRRAAAFDHFYQPGLDPEVPAGTRPWARRRSTGDGNLA